MSEFETEYAPGLPEPLPAGERLLWQGKPHWYSLAVQAFHVRAVAIYFVILAAWRGWSVFAAERSLGEAVVAALWLVPFALAAAGVLALLAYWSARTTVYSITSRRIVMRYGMALPMTLNIPFRAVDAVEMSIYRDGTGNIPLKIADKDKLAYLALWPHVRPWRINRPQPMLRAIPDVRKVAQLLSRAMMAASGQPAQAIVDLAQPSSAAPAAASRPLASAVG